MDAVVSSISLNTPVGAEICLAIGWAANGAPFESAPQACRLKQQEATQRYLVQALHLRAVRAAEE